MSRDERLHAWFDGELPHGEAAEMDRATDPAGADAAMARAAAELRALDDLLDLVDGANASPGFTDRVVAAARVDGALDLLPAGGASPEFTVRVLAAARRRRRGLVLRIAAPLAAAAAVLVAFLLAPSGKGPPPVDLEAVEYRWETDTDTFDSLGLTDLRDAVLMELDAT